MNATERKTCARLGALASAYALLLAGCGYVGDTLPPLLHIPGRVTDLAAVQRGDQLVAQFTVPQLTTEGTVIKREPRVELHAGTFEPPFQTDAWAAASKTFTGAPVVEGRQRYEIPCGEWVGRDVVLAVKVIGANGRDAGWSDFRAVAVVPPPEKPAGLRAEASAAGVRLSWQARGTAFRVFRRADSEANWTVLGHADKPEWTDPHAEYGKSYLYMVQTAVKAGSGEAESDPSEAVRITPEDHFPPAVPAGLTVVPSTASVELMWERNTESDLAGYRVYRSDGGAFMRLAEIRDTPAFSDTQVQPGKSYRYEVTAFDQSGNESPHSPPVQVSAP